MKSVVLKTWEVRAILDDRKTTIRRVVKGDIPSDAKFGYTNFTPEGCISCIGTWGDLKRNVFIKYPYSPGKGYRNGEAIYVREGFRLVDFSYIDGDWSATVEYNADYGYGPRLHYLKNGADEKIGWRPPVNMPLEAARMFLRVIDVRVERLHEITMDGMLAEGVIPNDVKGGQWQQWQNDYMKPAWDIAVKPKDLDVYGWDVDPWVWVIKIRRISKEEAIWSR